MTDRATAITWYRTAAAGCDRAASWLDDVASGRTPTGEGPIPLNLARNIPPSLLRQWANNERANRAKHLLAANDLVLGRTRP